VVCDEFTLADAADAAEGVTRRRFVALGGIS
jgi:hypothetical protein